MAIPESHAAAVAIRVFLRGGLGNQFFQWMHARNLAARGLDVCLDTSFLRAVAGNQARGRLELAECFADLGCPLVHTPALWRFERAFSRLARWAGILQTDAEVCSGRHVLPLQYGYFQTPLDPEGVAVQHARRTLRLSAPAAPGARAAYAAIHVRGGDYLRSRYNRQQIGVLHADYYDGACRKLPPVEGGWLVVSDDYDEARSLFSRMSFPGVGCIRFLDEELGGRDTPEQALQALLGASALVCANSSFSAMAAYLGQSARVIAPSPWFRGAGLGHLCPAAAGWLAMPARFRDA